MNQHHVVVFESVVTDDDRGLERLDGATPLFPALVLDTFFIGGQWKVIGRTENDLSRHLPAYRVSMAPDEWYAESFDARRRRLASAVEIEALPCARPGRPPSCSEQCERRINAHHAEGRAL